MEQKQSHHLASIVTLVATVASLAVAILAWSRPTIASTAAVRRLTMMSVAYCERTSHEPRDEQRVPARDSGAEEEDDDDGDGDGDGGLPPVSLQPSTKRLAFRIPPMAEQRARPRSRAEPPTPPPRI